VKRCECTEDEASPTTHASQDPRRHNFSRMIIAASATIAAMIIIEVMDFVAPQTRCAAPGI
jgi:hypothetical protein